VWHYSESGELTWTILGTGQVNLVRGAAVVRGGYLGGCEGPLAVGGEARGAERDAGRT